MAALRTAANARATSALLEQHENGQRVFELTLPTGFGKTYAGLRAALTLGEALDSRVIYALPYTSIIDQVDDEIRDVFDVGPMDPEYTIHHHLADTRTHLNRDENPSTGREILLAEAWQSGLVLTTFTQLFESVAGPQNVQSMKLPALQDSVIVIDEPQAISLDWWGLMGRLTTYLADEYNATSIYMTATQPKILSKLPFAPTPTPLVTLQDQCTSLLSDGPRVRFELHRSLVDYFSEHETRPLPLRTAADKIESDTIGSTNSLAIVNTVGCASAFTKHVGDNWLNLADELLDYHRERSDEFDAAEYLEQLGDRNPGANGLVTALTTRLRPADSRALLECLRHILDEDSRTPFDTIPTITVSTQLIEAGVDLSFDRLYRDYAPLPTLVQAAGRCNRRFGDGTSSVTVWRLDSPEESDYIPSQLIYGDRSLLRPTQKALSKLRGGTRQTQLPEELMITTGVESYYDELHAQRRTSERQDDLVTAFDHVQGKRLREATVVSQEYPTQDVFVLVTAEEARLYQEYEHFQESGDWTAAKDRFQALKTTLVSVPVEEESIEEYPIVADTTKTTTGYDILAGTGVTLADDGTALER